MTYISETKIEQIQCVKCGSEVQTVHTEFQRGNTLTESCVFVFTVLIVTCSTCGWKWTVDPLDT